MADFGVTEKLIQLFIDNGIKDDLNSMRSIFITFIVFCSLNIIFLGINWWVQFKLKNKEFDVINHNLREVERMKVLRELYLKLETLTYYMGNTAEVPEYVNKTKEINSYVTQNKLFISVKYQAITTEFIDYILAILSDFRKNDLKKKSEILDKFIKEFNR